MKNSTSSLVLLHSAISLRMMNRSATKPERKSRRVIRPTGLRLPEPVPPKARGTVLPPSIPEIARRLEPVCRQYGITQLEIFGSVARGEAAVGSDVDLIARFVETPGLEMVTIEEECERVLGVPVHLVTFDVVENMTNPYRKASIQQDRRVIYAA
jgi:uncharacterized protein